MAISGIENTTAALEQTLDTPLPRNAVVSKPRPVIARQALPSESSDDSGQPVELITGTAPKLTNETNTLLRCRLRLASLILTGAFGLFFVYNAFVFTFESPFERPLWIGTGLIALMQGVLGGTLCRRCDVSTGKLRLIEAIVFGVPAIFFCGLHFWSFHTLRVDLTALSTGQKSPADLDLIENPITPWMLLIFNYAILIPNSWRRAAVVIGLFVTVPIAVMIFNRCTCVVTGSIYDTNLIVTSFFRLAIAGVTGVVGVATINRLRTEVFEAKQLGQYQLKMPLGAGGMGEVYLAEHQLMKRPVALKLIRPNKADDPQAIARFEREVRATAKLSHWNSIEIYDYGHTADGTFYYVMEYLPGMNLGEIVDRYGPMPAERVIYLMEQICAGLGEAHRLGLIHRDIKPGNIYAAYRGGYFDVGKILDFGLAKPLVSNASIDLTVAGSITGSPLYMSPEQATHEQEPDARSDIYSLGAVMYFLLSGRPPFTGDNPIKVLLAHASQPVMSLRRIRPELPADIEAVVLRCLEKNPADRYTDTRELAAALKACQSAGKWDYLQAENWWDAHCELHPDTACQAAREISDSAV